MVPLQRVIFPELDLPKINYNAVRGLKASHWTMLHLGEVNVGKNDPLRPHYGTSRGALTFFGSSKGLFLTGPWAMYRTRAQYSSTQNVYDNLQNL